MTFFQKLMANRTLVQDQVGAEGGGAGGGGQDNGSDGGDEGGSGNEGGDNGGKEGDDDKGMDPEKRQLLKESMSRKEKIKELSGQLEEASTQRQELESKLEELNSKFEGIDLEQYQELMSQQKEGEKRKLAEEGNYEELEQTIRAEADSRVEQVESEANEKISELTSTIEELQSQLGDRDTQLKSLVVDSQFGQSQFIRENLVPSPQKTQKIYGDHFEVGEDGKMVAYDKPSGAKDRTKIVDKNGDPASFDVALQRIIEADPDKDTILRSKVKEGSDSKESNGRAKKTVGKGVDRIRAGLDSQGG